MKRKIIHWQNQSGKLHCDNPACGYDLPVALEFNESLIGFRCPKCGSDMLTRSDYEAAVKLYASLTRVVNFLNRWFGWLGTKEPPKTPAAVSVSIRCHNGDVIVRTKEVEGV